MSVQRARFLRLHTGPTPHRQMLRQIVAWSEAGITVKPLRPGQFALIPGVRGSAAVASLTGGGAPPRLPARRYVGASRLSRKRLQSELRSAVRRSQGERCVQSTCRRGCRPDSQRGPSTAISPARARHFCVFVPRVRGAARVQLAVRCRLRARPYAPRPSGGRIPITELDRFAQKPRLAPFAVTMASGAASFTSDVRIASSMSLHTLIETTARHSV